ncbi:MAG TPA: GntR family transcriptional regulator [Candidatus Dormibacteraeota bacterium]|nr:GntR family transcriptional regulator [Candidatus Dormibacteraeota bacterium]
MSLQLAVTKDSLVSQVAKQLVAAIRRGQIAPGTRLIETEIAQRLNISRGPLREALQQLSQRGLVVKVPNRGWFVLEPSRSDLAGMVVLRAALEGLAAWLVASRRDARERETLGRIVRSMREAAARANAERVRQLERRFREAVCRASGNRFLLETWSTIDDGLRLVSTPDPDRPNLEEEVERCERLLSELTEGTPASAGRRFEEHALASGQALLGCDPVGLACNRVTHAEEPVAPLAEVGYPLARTASP